MRRVVVVGRGGAGKSVLARDLGAVTGLPVIELDKEFWNDQLEPRSASDWARHQLELSGQPCWIMDGDLGPYDVLEPRLRRADTIVMIDLPLWLCVFRALRRGRERRDFWRWTLRWRRHSRPGLLSAVSALAPDADLVILRSRSSVRRWLESVGG